MNAGRCSFEGRGQKPKGLSGLAIVQTATAQIKDLKRGTFDCISRRFTVPCFNPKDWDEAPEMPKMRAWDFTVKHNSREV